MHGPAAHVNAPKLIFVHADHRFNAGPALFPAFVLPSNMLLHVIKPLLHRYKIIIAFIHSLTNDSNKTCLVHITVKV